MNKYLIPIMLILSFSTSQAQGPAPLALHFASGSVSIRAEDIAVLDQATTAFRTGHPVVMVISGGADATGSAAGNLALSQRRANVVLQELVARGIPVDLFQVLAKGQTEAAKEGERARRVEITWR